MRLYGSVRLGSTSTPPDMPARVLHLHVLGAEDRAHGLHQDQADAPGGQQRLQRAAVEPADDAALEHHRRPAPETRKQPVSPATRYQSKAPGQVAPEQVLHHVGGVGADHDQLAVGHVDDAHQAVGDGEPQRGEQQDRSQADAGEERRPRFGARQARLRCPSSASRASRERPGRSRRRRRSNGMSSVLAAGVARTGKLPHRGDARRLVHALQVEPGGDHLERSLDPGSLSAPSAFRTSGAIVRRRPEELLRRPRAAPRDRARAAASRPAPGRSRRAGDC